MPETLRSTAASIYSVSRKILNKTIKKFLTCHFERSEKSSASKILRMHKISPSGRDDIFFIYVMKFWFRLGRVRYRKNNPPGRADVRAWTYPASILARSADMSGGKRWLIAGLLACLPWLAMGAETFYVTDRLLIGVHEDREQDSAPLEILPTGAALEVISRDKEFAKVRTASGVVGWIDSNYLMMERPAQLLLMELEALHEQTRLRLQETEARLRELGEKTTPEEAERGNSERRHNDLISEFNAWLGLEFPLISTAPWKWAPLALGFLLVFFLGGFSLNRAVCRRYYLVERGKRSGNKTRKNHEDPKNRQEPRGRKLGARPGNTSRNSDKPEDNIPLVPSGLY
uniref:SH3 domain protein n=1 Tax=Candidatus Kentrum sp. UNK TaxID=2126344 RepID=A0A451AJ84_9GAMM|nr:MAG: SH3 domain protein [Candidatus Kentron sp. UNK]VFK70270.1 MAG: SH3 domain protein [Candidatus Kentron sp. UNK]